MTTTEQIAVRVNGQELDVPRDCTIAELLKIAEMRSHLVAVEVNLNIVPKSQHASHALQPGDAIEVVTLVGGG